MSKGTNASPVRSARSLRYESNIAFQAFLCTLAVSVSTPSRSKRQARTVSGKPSMVVSLVVLGLSLDRDVLGSGGVHAKRNKSEDQHAHRRAAEQHQRHQ